MTGTSPTITTTLGDVAGVALDGVHAFLGLPYAAPPVGARRFKPPQPAEGWTGVRDASRHGAPSIQRGRKPGDDRVGYLFGGGCDVAMSEDCLVLNVWTPTGAAAEGGGIALDNAALNDAALNDAASSGAALPVLVWFHGGGFTQGASGDDVYSGARLARTHDVVVVSVNHRLGLLGFCDLEGVLGAEYAGSGNAGMLDLVASLEWVRDNIATFGGDPNAVTVFGESGGGGKVSALLAMPAAEGLFHRGVVQSGPPFQFRDPASAAEVTDKTLAALGLDVGGASKLLELDAAELFAAQVALGAGGGPSEGGMSFAPTVHTDAITDVPEVALAAGASANVPLIVGTNLDEARFMLMMMVAAGATPSCEWGDLTHRLSPGVDGEPDAIIDHYRAAYPDLAPFDLLLKIESEQFRIRSQRLLEAHHAGGGAPSFSYLLRWVWPERRPFGAFHGLDIPLVFGNLPGSMADDPAAQRISAGLGERWTSFAATGTPVGADGMAWPAYEPERRSTLLLDDPFEAVDDPFAADRAAWHGVGTGPTTRPWSRVFG